MLYVIARHNESLTEVSFLERVPSLYKFSNSSESLVAVAYLFGAA